MHFRTDGIVAAAAVSAELWQSRHCSPSAICCLCEYAIGWPARAATVNNIRMLRAHPRLRSGFRSLNPVNPFLESVAREVRIRLPQVNREMKARSTGPPARSIASREGLPKRLLDGRLQQARSERLLEKDAARAGLLVRQREAIRISGHVDHRQ